MQQSDHQIKDQSTSLQIIYDESKNNRTVIMRYDDSKMCYAFIASIYDKE